MLCPNCEAENRDDARFCDECGFPLSGTRSYGGASGFSADVAPEQENAFEDIDDSAHETQAPADEDIAFDFEDFPTFNYPGADDPIPADLGPDSAHVDSSEPAQNTMPFSAVSGQGQPEGLEAGEAGQTDGANDPFAGYSQSIDEQEYGFANFNAANEAEVDESTQGKPGVTMEMPRVNERPVAAASRDFRISSGQGRPRSRVAIIAVAGVVVGIALAVLITYLLGLWGGIAVPDVTGMTESDARAALEEEGFAVRSTQVKSDDTEGLVLVMDPAGNSRAAEGSEVVIHISTARFVPDIAGKSEEEARSLLGESGYENVRYEKEKSEGAEGIVLSVSPEAGTRAKSNAEVVVKVSEAYRVPDVSGLDIDAAAQAIVDSGLAYGIAYVDTDQYEDGAIIGTEPEVGTQVEKDSYVSINVARRRGAELVALTQAMFAQGQTVTIGGVDYEIESADSIEYAGDDIVSFTVTGLPKTTFFGKTIYADEQVVSGQVTWSEDNEVIDIS